MTTKAGYYGSDDVKNRFPVPAMKGTRSQNEKYFVLVDKETGKKIVYNEEFGADKVVGEYDKSGNLFLIQTGGVVLNQKRKNFLILKKVKI